MILKINISQGNVATQSRCGEMINNHVIANIRQCACEKKIKIGKYLAKMQTKVNWHLFMTHGVDIAADVK